MYCIRHKKTGLWYDPCVYKSWVKKPTIKSLFYNKVTMKSAIRCGLLHGDPVEIVAMMIVPKET